MDPALDGLTLSMRFVLHYTPNLNMSICGNFASQKVPLSISNKPWKAIQDKNNEGGKLRLDSRDDLLFPSQSFQFALFPRQALITAELWKNCGGCQHHVEP